MDYRSGSALQVEDLDVTLELKTYYVPIPYKLKAIRRIIKNLIERDIVFKIEEKLNKHPQWFTPKHSVWLEVKGRKIWFDAR